MTLGYYMAFMPVYIKKSGDLVRCYRSGTAGRTNEQGKIELLSQWTMDGWDEQKKILIFLRCGFKIDEQRSERRAKRGAGAVSWLSMACMEPWSGNGVEKLIIRNHKSILNNWHQMISLFNRHSLPLPDTIIKSAETDECVAPWLLGDFDSDTHF